jgi:hypothetical protein
MDSLISMVAQRSGISEAKARTAVDTVVGFLKEHAPAGLSSQIDSLVSGAGSGTGGIVSGIAGMLGATKERHE